MWFVAKCIKFALIGVAFGAALGGLTMVLWNALIPELFHGPTLTFWQAVGLLALSHLLLRGGTFRHGGWHHRRWKHGLQERLAAMTPEEREKFLSRWDEWACCAWSGSKRETDKKAG